MNILVVGDTISDKYIFGNIERVNPEACYSVVLDYEYSKTTLGGAANVAANIKSLIGNEHQVYYLGYVSPEISKSLSSNKVSYLASKFILDEDLLSKERYVYNNHILLRLDINKNYKSLISTSYYYDLEFRLENNNHFTDLDLIVISDYAKSTLENGLLTKLFTKYNDKVFMFDIKKPIEQKNIPNKIIFKCNNKEWKHFNDIGFFPNSWFIKTEGKYGYSISEPNGEYLNWKNFPAINVGEIVDTVGCGDSFIAGMAADFVSDRRFDPERHAKYGNICSAAKVSHFGTVVLKKEDIKKYE